MDSYQGVILRDGKPETFRREGSYVGKPHAQNIWYAHNEFWYLLCDEQGEPLEFSDQKPWRKDKEKYTPGSADAYIDGLGLTRYQDKYQSGFNRIGDKEGLALVQDVPTIPHDMSFLCRTSEQIEELVKDFPNHDDFDAFALDLFKKILAATNAAEQSRLWLQLIISAGKENKKARVTHSYGKNVNFNKTIRSIFAPPDPYSIDDCSYQGVLAKLEMWKSPLRNPLNGE